MSLNDSRTVTSLNSSHDSDKRFSDLGEISANFLMSILCPEPKYIPFFIT